MDDFYEKLGLKIKKLRQSSGLSQLALASELGIKRVSVSQIENGKRKISADEIVQLSRIFNITTDILLDLKKDFEVIVKKDKLNNDDKKEIRISKV